MEFSFDFARTVQAVSVLLDLQRSRRMNYMRLLKLLYIADRESLLETGAPITGDRPVAMKRGPVLSHVYNLIKGESTDAGRWEEFVHKDDYEVELLKDPGRGKLSRYDIAKLTEIWTR